MTASHSNRWLLLVTVAAGLLLITQTIGGLNHATLFRREQGAVQAVGEFVRLEQPRRHAERKAVRAHHQQAMGHPQPQRRLARAQRERGGAPWGLGVGEGQRAGLEAVGAQLAHRLERHRVAAQRHPPRRRRDRG